MWNLISLRSKLKERNNLMKQYGKNGTDLEEAVAKSS